MQDITQELVKWLEERKATLVHAVFAPAGGSVRPENFIPEGWVVKASVYAPEEKTVDASPYSALADGS